MRPAPDLGGAGRSPQFGCTRLTDPAATQLALADLFRALADQLRYDDAAARLLADLESPPVSDELSRV
jgi:hypothetical protein